MTSDSPDVDTEFREYAAARLGPLRRTAYLMCGDWHLAEDLVQTALAKLYVGWRRVDRRENVDAYTRRILLRCLLDERRRPWRRERPTGDLPEAAAAAGPAVEERDALWAALRQMPPGQRAVVVLRYWEDLSVQETAAVLELSEGAVKSQAARGLDQLRRILGSRLGYIESMAEGTHE